jgi:aminopeptidase N
VIRTVGVHADAARFERLLARLKGAQGEEDRELYAAALAGGRDLQRAQALLAAALDGVVPPNIASSLPRLVSVNSPFGDLAYEFTVTHWERLAKLAGTSAAPQLLPNAARHFNDLRHIERLLEDQRRMAGTEGAAFAARAADRIRLLTLVKEREAAALAKYLGQWRPSK